MASLAVQTVLLFMWTSLFQISLSQTNSICENMDPICTDKGLQFTALNANISAPVGNNYDCLKKQPDPTWYYLKISDNSQETGTLYMDLSAPQDIDYIIYGPFQNIPQARSQCGSLGVEGNRTFNAVKDCSYDKTNLEKPSLYSVSPGQIYVMLITNYAKIVQNVSLVLRASRTSTAFTDCSIITPNPTEDPSLSPTNEPTFNPSTDPTQQPSVEPTVEPTALPSASPSTPTSAPSASPTVHDSKESNSPNGGMIALYVIIGLLMMGCIFWAFWFFYKKKNGKQSNENFMLINGDDEK